MIGNPAKSWRNHEAQATTSIQHLYANCRRPLLPPPPTPSGQLHPQAHSYIHTRASSTSDLQPPPSYIVSHRLGAIIIAVIYSRALSLSPGRGSRPVSLAPPRLGWAGIPDRHAAEINLHINCRRRASI